MYLATLGGQAPELARYLGLRADSDCVDVPSRRAIDSPHESEQMVPFIQARQSNQGEFLSEIADREEGGADLGADGRRGPALAAPGPRRDGRGRDIQWTLGAVDRG